MASYNFFTVENPSKESYFSEAFIVCLSLHMQVGLLASVDPCA